MINQNLEFLLYFVKRKKKKVVDEKENRTLFQYIKKNHSI